MSQTLTPRTATANPWHALWAMLVGFFMILVDATIVSVANPSIMAALGASYDSVIWVTSAYLLAYAVPLLVAGRLGDRFGPKNLYLVGLTLFTVASLWCGLADSIGMLIIARVVQGLGAALLTPQTLSTITRIFPADRRGVAMSLWGATAGVATLVGPLAGGLLLDGLGWQWIFFVNVPVGIVGVGLALRLIPQLDTGTQRFDLLGMALSGIGMFMIVFALQEGQSHNWAPWVWGTIAGGIGFMAAFLFWQYVNPNDPLVPLRIFARPRLLPVQHRCGHHRFRRDGDDRAGDVLRPGGMRALADAFGAGGCADGHRIRRAGTVRRQNRRQVASASGDRLRLLVGGDLVDVAVHRNDVRHPDLAGRAAVDGHRRRNGVHLVAAGSDRDPQSAAASGGRGIGRLQHHPSGRVGAGQRGRGGLHDVADQ